MEGRGRKVIIRCLVKFYLDYALTGGNTQQLEHILVGHSRLLLFFALCASAQKTIYIIYDDVSRIENGIVNGTCA